MRRAIRCFVNKAEVAETVRAGIVKDLQAQHPEALETFLEYEECRLRIAKLRSDLQMDPYNAPDEPQAALAKAARRCGLAMPTLYEQK